jgi:hypothetical protein
MKTIVTIIAGLCFLVIGVGARAGLYGCGSTCSTTVTAACVEACYELVPSGPWCGPHYPPAYCASQGPAAVFPACVTTPERKTCGNQGRFTCGIGYFANCDPQPDSPCGPNMFMLCGVAWDIDICALPDTGCSP